MAKTVDPSLKIVFAAMIWGTSGLCVKLLALPPTTLAFFRMAVPALITGVYLFVKKDKIIRQENRLMLVASLLNGLRMFFFFAGFTLTSIVNGVLMLYTWPIFATLFSALLLKEKVALQQWLLLLVSFTGIVLIYAEERISFHSNDFLGMSSMLVAGMVYSLTVIIFKRCSAKSTKSESLFFQNLVGGIFFLPFFLVNQPLPTVGKMGAASLYSVMIGLVAFGLFFSALKNLSASKASALAYIEVVVAFVLGIAVYGESISVTGFLGGILIVVSAFLMSKT